ncbi:MAG TPA: hypothetical protein VES40_02355, partial [Ilumatobacteraceae bacterium]|nr:hypothetical protein [Ilumatobacteraceae bacterium]
MPVTAKFIPDSIHLVPGTTATLTLRLHSSEDAPQVVNLQPSGDLAEFVALDVSTAAIESNQIFDVPVSIGVGLSIAPGEHQPTVELTSECGATTAALNAEVETRSEHSVELSPLRSRGSSSGRHTVRVVNSGNVPVTVDLAPDTLDGEITLDVEPTFVVTPGATAQVTLRVTPATTYWNGPAQEHPFVVRSTSSDGSTDELAGTYEQRPRVAGWVGPAAAGAGAALLIGAIAWFAFLRPWVESTADDAAADALEQDRAALQEKIDELDASAAEAEELPLGLPTDLRLSVAPAGGNSETDSQTVPSGEQLSVTDVVFQNPTGAVGTVSMLRDGEVLL